MIDLSQYFTNNGPVTQTARGFIYLLTDVYDLKWVPCGLKGNAGHKKGINLIRKFMLGFLRYRKEKLDDGTIHRVLHFDQKRLDIRILSNQNDLFRLMVAIGYPPADLQQLQNLHDVDENKFEEFVEMFYQQLTEMCFKTYFKIYFNWKSLGKNIEEIELITADKMSGIYGGYAVDFNSREVKTYNRTWVPANLTLFKNQGIDPELFSGAPEGIAKTADLTSEEFETEMEPTKLPTNYRPAEKSMYGEPKNNKPITDKFEMESEILIAPVIQNMKHRAVL